MGRPGAEKDPAGREFEALLAALPRKPSAARVRAADTEPRAPVGDAEFEDLLDKFRGMDGPAPRAQAAAARASSAGLSATAPRSRPTPENLLDMLDTLDRERRRLMSRRDAIRDEAALTAIRGLDRVTTNLQIALMRDLPDRVLLFRSHGQHFALPLAEVAGTYGRDELEFDEKKGARARGEGWLPVRFLGAPGRGNVGHVSVPAHDHVVIAAASDGALALCVESVVGVMSATLTPLDAILQGAQGLRGVAITETGAHALVLDLGRLGRGA